MIKKMSLGEKVRYYEKKSLYFIIFLVGILFSLQIYCAPINEISDEGTIVISKNRIQMEIEIPNEVTDMRQYISNYARMDLDGARVDLEIDKSTIKKRIKLSKNEYEELRKDKPDTTFFEEMPDMKIGKNKFSVTKTVYDTAMNETITVIEATTELDDHYIYNIKIKGDEKSSYPMLNEFTTFNVRKTLFNAERTSEDIKVILLISAVSFLCGIFIIISEIIKKKFWIKSLGTVTGSKQRSKITVIYVTHILENGEEIHAECGLSYAYYSHFRTIGKEVAISYSKKNPRKVDILSSKFDMINGIVVLCCSIFFIVLLYI